MSKQPKRAQLKRGAQTPAGGATRAPSRVAWARAVALATAVVGTPAVFAVWNTGNRFGPIKATLLALSATTALVTLAADRDVIGDLRALYARSWVALGGAALLAVAVLGAVFGRAPGGGILGTYSDFRGVDMLACCIGVMLTSAVAARHDDLLVRLWWPLNAGAAIIIAGALLQFLKIVPGGYRPNESIARVFSTAGNSSNLGVVLVLLAPLLLASGLKLRAEWRGKLSLVLAVACVPTLLWTSSRGAILGLAAAAVTWALVGRARFATALGNRRVQLALGGTLALTVAVVALTPGTLGRIGALLDTHGRSVQIRLDTWTSAAEMIAARPLIGSGAGSFRTVFPAYMRPGTIDGLQGPQVVEAAHNVVLDAGVSFGLLGLAAAAFALAGVARTAFRRQAESAVRVETAAAAAAIAGGFVALLFHYVTLDSGPLLALALGLIAAAEVADAGDQLEYTPTSAQDRVPRIALGIGAGVLGVTAMAYALTTVADVSYARGLGLAASGAPWSVVREPLDSATSMAPWEPRFAEGVGTAAAMVVSRGLDEVAYADGRAGFARTLELKPGDAYALGGDANLILMAANVSKRRDLYVEALARHEEAVAADPANGTPLAGLGSCLAGLGRWPEAVTTYEQALRLSPNYVLALDNLAIAYRAVGRDAEAETTQKRADSLRKASR